MIRIFDPDGNDVTDKFDITKNPGTIHIYLEIITIWSTGISKSYDGYAIKTDMHSILVGGDFKSDYVSDEMISGAYSGKYGTVRLVVNNPSMLKNVGSIAAGFKVELYDGKNNLITDNYKIKKECGALTVTPKQIAVQAGSAESYYTARPLTSSEYKIHGTLAEGDYVYECVTEGSQLIVGRSENIVKKIVIFNADGEDVTANYSIELLTGILRVLSGES